MERGAQWTMLKKPCQKINVLETTQPKTAILGKAKKNSQTSCAAPRREFRGKDKMEPVTWMQRTPASADEPIALEILTCLARQRWRMFTPRFRWICRKKLEEKLVEVPEKE